MPILNINKCYQIPKDAVKEITCPLPQLTYDKNKPNELPPEWLEFLRKMADLVHSLLPESSTPGVAKATADTLYARYIYHIDTNRYEHVGTLGESMWAVYQLLNTKDPLYESLPDLADNTPSETPEILSLNEKQAIVSKISDKDMMGSCTEGVLVRLRDIITSRFSPRSLEDILYLVRRDLIYNVARKNVTASSHLWGGE